VVSASDDEVKDDGVPVSDDEITAADVSVSDNPAAAELLGVVPDLAQPTPARMSTETTEMRAALRLRWFRSFIASPPDPYIQEAWSLPTNTSGPDLRTPGRRPEITPRRSVAPRS
jgi:hypothetical protein